MSERTASLVNMADIQRHYAALSSEDGFDSRCRIVLPDGLAGKTALDVCCRRGKGVYKLSERVGAAGLAIGVDWREDFIDDARRNEAAGLARSGLAESNMAFHVVYPELLGDCVETGSVDVAFINDVLNLTFSPVDVLAQVYGVLKTGGVLVCQTVVCGEPREANDLEAARVAGDSVLAAPDRPTLDSWFKRAGFRLSNIVEVERLPVGDDRGTFFEIILHAVK